MTVKIYLWVIWELIWYPLVNREAYQLLTLSGAALDGERAEGEARKDRGTSINTHAWDKVGYCQVMVRVRLQIIHTLSIIVELSLLSNSQDLIVFVFLFLQLGQFTHPPWLSRQTWCCCFDKVLQVGKKWNQHLFLSSFASG